MREARLRFLRSRRRRLAAGLVLIALLLPVGWLSRGLVAGTPDLTSVSALGPNGPVAWGGSAKGLRQAVSYSEAGTISGVRFKARPGAPDRYLASLRGPSGALLGWAATQPAGPDGWMTATFGTPSAVAAKTAYTLVYWASPRSLARYAVTGADVVVLFTPQSAAPPLITPTPSATATTTATTAQPTPTATATAGTPTATTSTSAPTATTAGYAVGSGPSTMMFPEKPGLTVPKTSLTPYEGPTTVTGTYSQSNCIVSRQIRVNAGGHLSLTNCWIKVNVSDAGYGMIGKAGRIDLKHVLIDGSSYGDYTFPVIVEGGGSITYSEFVGNTDNARLSSNTRFEWNYVHDAKTRTSSGISHSDGIEVYYGAREDGAPATGPHIFIRNNYLEPTGAEGESGVINITNDFGPIDGVLVEGNTIMQFNMGLYLRGDGYCGCGGALKNIQVVNNRFFGKHEFYSTGYNSVVSYQPETGVTQWSGNTFIGPSGKASAFPLNLL